jgi:hypothetical protein
MPWQASPRDAALLNGLFGHGFEMDDTHIPSTTHPGSVVIPAALATLRGRISGTKFLVAVVVGYEVMARVGFAAGPAHILRGFHPTGTVGVFGAAAAAARNCHTISRIFLCLQRSNWDRSWQQPTPRMGQLISRAQFHTAGERCRQELWRRDEAEGHLDLSARCMRAPLVKQ